MVCVLIERKFMASFLDRMFINILSDCIAEYRRGLVLPMFQSRISKDLMEAYSFDQVIGK